VDRHDPDACRVRGTSGRHGLPATPSVDRRFVLRSPYDETARAATDPAGWISVLVVATTSDGTSMATDSVRFDEAHNRWSTRPAETEAAGRFTAQSADPAVTTFDRPAVMTLHPAPRREKGRFEAAGSKPKICYMKKGTQDVGVTRVTVGELDLTNNWGGQFNYTDTNTSTPTRTRVPSRSASSTKAREAGVRAVALRSPKKAAPSRSILWIPSPRTATSSIAPT
jgi:hypothetical protein